ncbi:GNAT family N-acetyltransferase [Photobacterium alginatilyticum]|uniref:GNAT family N-acetyltransferase n=1 Tax=Photobacterium alginatilyticum TaxID=1775171 RepID=A0ABW9YQ78_9GAMM|nr:GNAT family N-acetyltransferase [Photobacterium alginatilyticum]NBI56097.1 GNAT family N-acetyltransferase [Photobacterium alginatilyticum]
MIIVEASTSYSELYHDYITECVEGGVEHYNEAIGNPEEYLNTVVAYSQGQQLPEGWVPISTYFCIDDNRLLGAIRLRHGSNDYIDNVIGHVGYETRPSARGLGVAQTLLTWLKENMLNDEVTLICSESNMASQKVIEKCGGVFITSFHDNIGKKVALRYLLSNHR